MTEPLIDLPTDREPGEPCPHEEIPADQIHIIHSAGCYLAPAPPLPEPIPEPVAQLDTTEDEPAGVE